LNKSDGTSSVIGVGGGSLAEVVAGINSANVGVSATAVQTSPGQYRLQIGAATTGAASQFTLSGIDVAFPMTILSTGSDASITVGGAANPQRYTVTSATNTFKGVVTGLDFTVSKLDSNVTVSSTVDPASVATQISGVVTNINNLLSTMTTNTAWDSSSKSGGPLLGDSTVRSLQQSILSTVAGMAAPGLSVTSGGQLKFDSVAFTAAFKSDPTAVANAYGATSSFTPNTGVVGTAKYTNAVATTLAGSYAVNVTTNAKAEQWQMVPPGTGFVGRILSLTRGTTTINYTGSLIDTPTTAAAAFNAKLAQAGMGVSAAADVSGNIILTAAYAGSSQAFTATIDGGGVASKLTAGADIQGSIDGVAATGIGNILTVPVTESSDAAGLSVAVTASAADITASGGAIGTIDYQPGLAQKLGTLFTQMSDSATGQLVTAQAAATAQVKDLQTAIDSWTSRLDSYRASLNQKFTAMETSLSALKAQSTAMSQFFNTGTNSSSSSS
jgi:flagellar hook-associated protein 2